MKNLELFQLAKKLVFGQSGDGSVLIVSSGYYKELAEELIEYEKTLEEPEYTKIDYYENTATCTNGEEFSQEAIVFAKDKQEEDFIMYDAVIYLQDYVVVK